jgi:hypothetical protein
MSSNTGTTTGSSTPNPPISPASSTASPASIIERRNRRRSSALSGPHPADVPLTDSDQRLAILVARINLQNARDAAPPATPQPLPTLVVPALSLSSDSTTAVGEPIPSTEKTPTQSTFRTLSSQRTARSVRRSHTRDGSISTTTFQLSPIKGESDSKTPTKLNPRTSPIRGEQKLSPIPSPVREEHRLSPNRFPLRGDYDLSPPLSPREVRLSPDRSFTRRMYTRSPLEDTFSQAEDENIEQLSSGGKIDPEVAAKSADAKDTRPS